MASSRIYTCDRCGAVRQESNHWHLLKVKSIAAMEFSRTDSGRSDVGVELIKWDDRLATEDQYSHLCGIGCSIKAISAIAADW